MDKAKVLDLIAEVEQHELLYNSSASGAQNFQKKERLWREIGQRLGISGGLAKKKFENLCDTYRKFDSKLQRLPSGSAGTAVPKWEFWGPLEFLSSAKHRRRVISNSASAVSAPAMDTLGVLKRKLEVLIDKTAQ